MPVLTGLVRVRRTASQTTLDKAQRAANVKDAFAWRSGPLTGLTVVLIDDVTTTGATFTACATAVRDARPDAVWGLAVAKKR
jgi:predicted amidophosphoribosyltransferase